MSVNPNTQPFFLISVNNVSKTNLLQVLSQRSEMCLEDVLKLFLVESRPESRPEFIQRYPLRRIIEKHFENAARNRWQLDQRSILRIQEFAMRGLIGTSFKLEGLECIVIRKFFTTLNQVFTTL